MPYYFLAPHVIRVSPRNRLLLIDALWALKGARRRWWHRLGLGNDRFSYSAGYAVTQLLPGMSEQAIEALDVRVYPQYQSAWHEAFRRVGMEEEAKLLDGRVTYRLVDDPAPGEAPLYVERIPHNWIRLA